MANRRAIIKGKAPKKKKTKFLSEFELKQEMDLTADQIKQANKDIEKLAKGIFADVRLSFSPTADRE